MNTSEWVNFIYSFDDYLSLDSLRNYTYSMDIQIY